MVLPLDGAVNVKDIQFIIKILKNQMILLIIAESINNFSNSLGNDSITTQIGLGYDGMSGTFIVT